MEPSRQMKSFLPLPVSDIHFKLRKSRKITGCLGWWITACPETQIRNCTADVNSEILSTALIQSNMHIKTVSNRCIQIISLDSVHMAVYHYERWFCISVHAVGPIQADSRPCASLMHTRLCQSGVRYFQLIEDSLCSLISCCAVTPTCQIQLHPQQGKRASLCQQVQAQCVSCRTGSVTFRGSRSCKLSQHHL